MTIMIRMATVILTMGIVIVIIIAMIAAILIVLAIAITIITIIFTSSSTSASLQAAAMIRAELPRASDSETGKILQTFEEKSLRTPRASQTFGFL